MPGDENEPPQPTTPHLTIGNTLINKDIHSPQSNISSLGELLITVSDKYRTLKKCLGTN